MKLINADYELKLSKQQSDKIFDLLYSSMAHIVGDPKKFTVTDVIIKFNKSEEK